LSRIHEALPTSRLSTLKLHEKTRLSMPVLERS
jgi:hypothetical protein